MIITLLLTGLLSLTQTEAVSDSTLTFRQTVFVNADYAKQPVVSLSRSDTSAVDTLDTLNEFVKIVLRADNTWEYIKLPGGTQDQEIFKQYWENSTANPYKKLQSDLPRAWAIWPARYRWNSLETMATESDSISSMEKRRFSLVEVA